MISLRSLGSTNLPVSHMGLGLAALGRPGYINLGHADDLNTNYDKSHMEAHAHEVLTRAYKSGIRYFDAARSYGLAEVFLASWIKKYHPKNIVIGSKWGYTYTADWKVQAKQHEVKEHSIINLNKQFQESNKLLGSNLKLYQIHSATLDTGVLSNREVHEKLFELKSEGLLIGLSLSGTKQSETLEQALRLNIQGERLFDTVQATFNLFERSAARMLEHAHNEGMGIIVKEALANGRLSNRNSDTEISPIRQQAGKLGVNEDALALAWVLQHNWIDVVLSGAATTEHLNSNLVAFNLTLNDEVLANLEEVEQATESYWQKRSNLAWN